MAPTPIIPPAIAWVVLTGIPNQAIDVSITPPPVSAQNPWNGRRFVSNIGIICSRIPSQIKLLYQMKMQYDFLFDLLFLSIFIMNQITNPTMTLPVTISRYIE